MDKQEIKLLITKEILFLLSRGDGFSAEVKGVNPHQGEPYYESIVLDYRVIELCQRPVNDIRKVEPVEIRIYEDQMPDVIALRQDFPVLPHVMIFWDDENKYLCLMDEPYKEVKHRLCGRLILECLDRWFILSARGELHKASQPLDPFFPSVQDNIVISHIPKTVKFERFRRVPGDVGQTWIQTTNDPQYMDKEYYPVIPIGLEKRSDNIIRKLPKTLLELSNMFPTQHVLEQFRRRLLDIVGIKTDPKAYEAYFDKSQNKLRNCQCMIYLFIPIVRKRTGKTEKYDIKAILINQPLSAILKDLGMVEEKSKLLHKQTSSLEGMRLDLKFFNVHYQFTTVLAQTCSGFEGEMSCDNKILQIGLGAIGSQIYENCLRSGYGNWMLLDDDNLLPHNLARHALDRRFVGLNKALSMALFAQSILLDTHVDHCSENILSPNDNTYMQTIFDSAQIIIDTSASLAVERHLARDIVSPAQRMSFFMNPSGNSAVMLLEDVCRKITLDLLEMQYYKRLCTNERYTKYFETPGEIVYSTTCRSISSQISQDNVSLFAALCSRSLKKYALSEKAKIIIWTFDGESVVSDALECCEYELRKSGNWRVMISKEIVILMSLERNSKLPKETGGVLIGSYDYSRKILYIVDIIKSPSDSIESPTSYIRGCIGLIGQVMDVSKRSAGYLNYVGEWHSHPSESTVMSSDDKSLFSSIIQWNRANCLPGCMIIVGADDYALHVSDGMSR